PLAGEWEGLQPPRLGRGRRQGTASFYGPHFNDPQPGAGAGRSPCLTCGADNTAPLRRLLGQPPPEQVGAVRRLWFAEPQNLPIRPIRVPHQMAAGSDEVGRSQAVLV